MSSSQKTVFRSQLNRPCTITYDKTDGTGRIEIMSFALGEEKKYEFVCVFSENMHFYKGTYDSVAGKEIIVKNISVTITNIDNRFLEKRYSILVNYDLDKCCSFGFYKRYNKINYVTTAVICNFVQKDIRNIVSVTPISEEPF